VTSAVRSSTHGQVRSRTDRRRRGTIYLLVVAVAANVVVIGVAAILLARVRVRGVHLEAGRREAQRLAYCGVEQAIAMMNNYTSGTGNWRADFTNDLETTPLDLGDGQVSFKLVDEDGDLADDVTDPVWIYGIGRTGDAVWVERAKARVDQGLPLEFLRTTIHSSGNLEVLFDLTLVGAPLSTDGNLHVNPTLDGDAEAVSLSGGGSVTGATTVPADQKGVPPRSVFDDYMSRATALTFNGDLNTVVLTPGTNEYDGSGTNPDGVYYIDTGGADMQIFSTRVHGTLIVDVGAGELYVNTCLMEPYRDDFPVLIVRGNVVVNLFGPSFVEAPPVSHNFNPVGAPYHGDEDGDTSDSYTSGMYGLVHVIGDLTLTKEQDSQGVFVVDGSVTTNGATTLVHNPDLMYNPPLGYADDPNSTAMVIRSGSWSRQPAP
jgi:hypothetical protein